MFTLEWLCCFQLCVWWRFFRISRIIYKIIHLGILYSWKAVLCFKLFSTRISLVKISMRAHHVFLRFRRLERVRVLLWCLHCESCFTVGSYIFFLLTGWCSKIHAKYMNHIYEVCEDITTVLYVHASFYILSGLKLLFDW